MSKTKTTGKSVATVSPKKNLPANVSKQMRALSGQGMENVGAKSIIIPRLVLLQSMSRQLQKSKPEYIKGAKVGDICDTATQKLYDSEEGIIFLPVHYEEVWMEWAPRGDDVSLVAIHATDDCMKDCEKDEDNKWINSAGNNIVETAQFYGLNLSDNGRQSFISFAKTQRKKAKRWMTLATGEVAEDEDGEFMPPLFYRTYKLTGKEESNKEGEWIGWIIERGDKVEDLKNGAELLQRALTFREAIVTGAAKADLEKAKDEARSAGDGRM